MPTATALELKPCPLYINGQPVISRGPKDIQRNPATGEAVAEIPRCTPEDISSAVEAAHRAFPSWSKTSVLQRCRVLFKYRQVLEEHAEELIALITEENGKTNDEARGSFQRGIECIEFACGAPTLMMGDTVDQVGTGVDGWSTRNLPASTRRHWRRCRSAPDAPQGRIGSRRWSGGVLHPTRPCATKTASASWWRQSSNSV